MRAAQFDAEKAQWTQTLPKKEFYSVRETAVLFLTGPVSVREAIRRGTLAGVKVNGVVRVRHAAILDYIARRSGVAGEDLGELTVVDIIPDRAKSPRTIVASLVPDPDGVVDALADDGTMSFLDEAEPE